MNKELLKFDNVGYSFGTKKVLTQINWVLKEGEQWVILGPNGAGKSTLLNLIYGFLWPGNSGTIFRQGESIINLAELRKSIGLVSSDLRKRIPRSETVLETVLSGKYAMLGYWTRKGEALPKVVLTKALRIMSDLTIDNLQKRKSQSLSHGEFQKVLLARSLMSDPYLILLDEPLEGLDPGAQENFLDTLSKYMKKNNKPSFIYVTHHIHDIIQEFKKLLVIKDSKIMFQGDLSDGLSSALVSSLYNYNFKVLVEKGRFRLLKNNAS